MFCVNCRKEIPNGSMVCPECGASQRIISPPPVSGMGSQSAGKNEEYNKMAVIGLVISGISLFINFWGIVGIAGIIVSVIGLINCNQTNRNAKTLAIIGIVIGAISVLYAFSMMV